MCVCVCVYIYIYIYNIFVCISIFVFPHKNVFRVSFNDSVWEPACSAIFMLMVFFHASVLSRFSHVPLFLTLWTITLQAPQSTGSSRQEYMSGLPCPPPGDLPNPGIEPAFPGLQMDSFLLSYYPVCVCVCVRARARSVMSDSLCLRGL